MKVWFFFFIYGSFFLLSARASTCERFHGFTLSADLCWREDLSAYVSRDCLDGSCQALFLTKRISANAHGRRISSSSLACYRAGAEVVVLADPQKNERSFCQFEDGSLRDADSVELKLP